MSKKQEPVYIVFDGLPGPDYGRFVEVETADGRSVQVGEWHEEANGYWRLGPFLPAVQFVMSEIKLTPKEETSKEKYKRIVDQALRSMAQVEASMSEYHAALREASKRFRDEVAKSDYRHHL